MKRHLFALMAIPLLLGIAFAAILPATGFTGMIVADDESDDLSENETSETNHEDDEEDEDEDDDGVDDDDEAVNERSLQIEANEKEVQIQSKLKNGENEDSIEIEFTVTDEPEIQVEYESEFGSTEMELSFKVKFYSLIEYNDTNLDGLYNESDDDLVQELRLDDSHVGYLPISYITELVGSTTIHIINATTTDGVFSLQFFIAEEFVLIDGALVTPTEMKIDIGINDFPYMSDSSILALKLRLEAETEYEQDEDTEDEEGERATSEVEVEVTMNGFTGFFSWSENVLVDGIMKHVKASAVDIDDLDSTKQKMYLNYPRGTKILHDPKIGVAGILLIATSPMGAPGFETLIAAFAFFTAAIVTIYRRRR
jgi:hypothetical protein